MRIPGEPSTKLAEAQQAARAAWDRASEIAEQIADATQPHQRRRLERIRDEAMRDARDADKVVERLTRKRAAGSKRWAPHQQAGAAGE